MNKDKAFTLIEILIVLAIIALLAGILLPSITMVRKQAKETAQNAQFAAIDMVLDAFKQDYGDYPPSNYMDGTSNVNPYYCGAQKLAEALLGWDLMGFHPRTLWTRNGRDTLGNQIYSSTDPNLRDRRGPYLEVAKTSVFRLGTRTAGSSDGLYNSTTPIFTGNFDATVPNYVISDVFSVKKISIITTLPGGGTVTTTKMAGSPILYYKANTTSKTLTNANPFLNIYNCFDNLSILQLRQLPEGNTRHRLEEIQTTIPGDYLYNLEYKLVDKNVFSSTGTKWPNRPDSYILISAGWDHEFGTKDDILSF